MTLPSPAICPIPVFAHGRSRRVPALSARAALRENDFAEVRRIGRCVVDVPRLFPVGACYWATTTPTVLTRRLNASRQASTHIALMVVSLALLPLAPHAILSSSSSNYPAFHILVLLTASIGLPFVLLSATSPLIQAWKVANGRNGLSPVCDFEFRLIRRPAELPFPHRAARVVASAGAVVVDAVCAFVCFCVHSRLGCRGVKVQWQSRRGHRAGRGAGRKRATGARRHRRDRADFAIPPPRLDSVAGAVRVRLRPAARDNQSPHRRRRPCPPAVGLAARLIPADVHDGIRAP